MQRPYGKTLFTELTAPPEIVWFFSIAYYSWGKQFLYQTAANKIKVALAQTCWASFSPGVVQGWYNLWHSPHYLCPEADPGLSQRGRSPYEGPVTLTMWNLSPCLAIPLGTTNVQFKVGPEHSDAFLKLLWVHHMLWKLDASVEHITHF